MRDALATLRADLAAIHAVWLRELLRMARDRGQLAGAVSRPVLWVLIFGLGLAPYLGAGFAGAPVGYAAYVLPAVVVLNILYPATQAALATVQDREAGFLRELLASPAPAWAVMTGKLLGGASVAVGQGLLVLALAPVVGVVPSVGGVLAALLPMAALAVAFAALALALAARMRSVVGFGVFANTLILPAFFLAGSIFPLTPPAGTAAAELPGWLTALVHVNPVTYALDELRWALLGYRQLDPVTARAVTAAFAAAATGLAAVTAFRR
ncbi:ABC-2 type transport system permease protein [Limimonas halophila]|uniref:Transport permease protein n=1 Tax=Limimonas halophila TaxID=1082479 RepID=A0A1G7RI49_9PROT|nr:ABC transporter permease [Limimonas halophila]SDG10506.1 ABC-2 type transport system permease protein [Limimonas halophila]